MDRIYINNIFTYLHDISNDHIMLTKDVREPANSSYYAESHDNLHNLYQYAKVVLLNRNYIL